MCVTFLSESCFLVDSEVGYLFKPAEIVNQIGHKDTGFGSQHSDCSCRKLFIEPSSKPKTCSTRLLMDDFSRLFSFCLAVIG